MSACDGEVRGQFVHLSRGGDGSGGGGLAFEYIQDIRLSAAAAAAAATQVGNTNILRVCRHFIAKRLRPGQEEELKKEL